MPTEIVNTTLYRDANMQGYWRLESDGADSSGNGYTLSGTAPTYAAGQFNNGADFELSSTQYITIANASCANLEITGAKTYVGWFKFESHTADTYPMAKCDAGLTALTGIRYSTTNGIGFLSSGLTTNTEVNSTVQPTNGVWYHVAGVYTGSKLQIYVNGSLTEVNATGSSTDTNGDFSIGRLGGVTTNYYFDGVADDCAVFDRALTEAEVLSMYNDTSSSKVILIV